MKWQEGGRGGISVSVRVCVHECEGAGGRRGLMGRGDCSCPPPPEPPLCLASGNSERDLGTVEGRMVRSGYTYLQTINNNFNWV